LAVGPAGGGGDFPLAMSPSCISTAFVRNRPSTVDFPPGGLVKPAKQLNHDFT
jgi:hypothetical protein